LSQKAAESYEKYKDRNIRIHQAGTSEGKRELLHVEDLQLGYGDHPLFQPVNFRLQHGEKLQLIGRNGAGKTTLIKAIVSASHGAEPQTRKTGSITPNSKLRLSVYEQEVGSELLHLTLCQAPKICNTPSETTGRVSAGCFCLPWS
jgi:ATPase subunit of ABC transporter with duplicated ATPase domains